MDRQFIWPCGVAAGGQFYATAHNLTGAAEPWSVFGIGNRTGATGAVNRLLSFGNGTASFSWRNSTNLFGVFAGTALTQTATDNAFHAFIGVANSTTSAMVVDGTAATGNASTQSIANIGLSSMADTGLTNPLTGDWCEGGIYLSALNSTQYANLNSNMHSATNGWNF